MEGLLLSIPAWGWCIAIAVLCLIMYRWGRKDAIPFLSLLFEPRMNFIRPTNSPTQLTDTVHGLIEMGLTPRMYLVTDTIVRVFFPGGLIINCTMPQMHIGLDKPECGVILLAHAPSELCSKAQWRCRMSCPKDDPDPEVPADSMSFLMSRRWGRLVLGARRHGKFMGKKPSGWNAAAFERELNAWSFRFDRERENLNQIAS